MTAKQIQQHCDVLALAVGWYHNAQAAELHSARVPRAPERPLAPALPFGPFTLRSKGEEPKGELRERKGARGGARWPRSAEMSGEGGNDDWAAGVDKLMRDAHTQSQLRDLLDLPDAAAHYGVQLDVFHLARIAPSVLAQVVNEPGSALPRLDSAARSAQIALSQRDGGSGEPKQMVHCRLDLWRISHPEMKPAIGSLRSRHCNALVTASGTVIRAGPTKLREHARAHECSACKQRFNLPVDPESGELEKLPESCPVGNGCFGKSFKVLPDADLIAIDHQEVKLQERVNRLQLGTTPRTITAVLEGDLVDSLQAGDDADVVGYLVKRLKSLKPNARPDVELVLRANNTRSRNPRKAAPDVPPAMKTSFEQFWSSHDECPVQARDAILKSICPQMFGMYHAKLAAALCLLGGSPGSKGGRSESHVLLIGDPGTGKSQLMSFASRLSQRSVSTTGMGSSSAGLTVTMVKDGNNQWALEAGALVLADGGLCCIDELSGLKNADRGSVLEAMEQQSLSIAKAGLVTRLSTRTSILAATNPKRPFDPIGSLSDNTGLTSPLLSRFDACVLLLDRQNKEYDERIADHILAAHTESDAVPENDESERAEALPPCDSNDARNGDCGADNTEGPGTLAHKAHWNLEELKQYFALVRDAFKPQLTPKAERMLQGYYGLQRRQCDQERTSVRMLEGLARLTQAHAKLCFRQTATTADAAVAIQLVEASLSGTRALSADVAIGNDFMRDPDAGMAEVERSIEAAILARLGYRFFASAEEHERQQELQLQQQNEQRALNPPPKRPRKEQGGDDASNQVIMLEEREYDDTNDQDDGGNEDDEFW